METITLDELMEQSVRIKKTIYSELFETEEAKKYDHKINETVLNIIVDFCDRNNIIIEED